MRWFGVVFALVFVGVIGAFPARVAGADWIEWTRILDSPGIKNCAGVALDPVGNAFVTGNINASYDGQDHFGSLDIFLTKWDSSGNHLWTRTQGNAYNNTAHGVAVDSSGNAYVTGFTFGSLGGQTHLGSGDVFLTKWDSSGSRIWTRTLGTAFSDSGSGVAVDSDGNVYVTGKTYGPLDGQGFAGDADIFLAKWDALGNRLWTRTLGNPEFNSGHSVSVDPAGNAYVTGITYGILDGQGNAGLYDIFLTKWDSSGNRLWTRTLGSSAYDYGRSIAVDIAGNAYVMGHSGGSLSDQGHIGNDDIFLAKWNAAGNLLWIRSLGTRVNGVGQGVAVDLAGNAYVTGDVWDPLHGQGIAGYNDVFLIKCDTSGNRLWTRTLGTSHPEAGNCVAVGPFGNAHVAGVTPGSLDGQANVGGENLFLFKANLNPPTPTPTPSATPSATRSNTPTESPTLTSTATPTASPTLTATEIATNTPTGTPTFIPTRTSTPRPPCPPEPTNTPLTGSQTGLWLNATFAADTLTVDMRVVYARSVASLPWSLFVAVEIAGAFYFYPAFTEFASPLVTGLSLPANFDSGEFELARLPLGASGPACFLVSWYAAFLDETGALAEPGLASSAVRLWP